MPKTNVQELENFEPPKYEFEVPSNNHHETIKVASVLFFFFLGKTVYSFLNKKIL